MANMAVSDKCTTAQSLLTSVRAMYTIYFNGGSKDQATSDCADALSTRITAIKLAAESGVSKNVSGNGPVFGGGTSCSIDALLNTIAGFTDWADGIKGIADGNYINGIISDLNRLLGSYTTLSDLRTTLCNASSSVNTKITALSNLLAQMDAYIANVQNYLNQASIVSIGISCSAATPGINSLAAAPGYGSSLSPFAVYNTAAAGGINALTQAKAILGNAASPGELIALAKEKIVANAGLDVIANNANAAMISFKNFLLS